MMAEPGETNITYFPAPDRAKFERALLGRWILGQFPGPAVHPDQFGVPVRKQIAWACIDLRTRGVPISIISVAELLSEEGTLAELGAELSVCSEEWDGFVPPEGDTHGAWFAERVLEYARQDRLMGLAKKLTDAVAAGRPVGDLLLEMGRAQDAVTSGPVAVRLGELESEGAESVLLGDRYLCRGGLLLFVGPTGIGKSSLVMQMIVSFALGRPCFGIAPARPLRSVLVQAENDSDDLIEMRDGVLEGMELTPEEVARVNGNVLVFEEGVATGEAFFERVARPLCAKHAPDLFFADPAFAYVGGNASDNEAVGAFMRAGFMATMKDYNCAGIVVHHTNKPPKGVEAKEWQAGDYAYLGAGAAEWANAARAVLAMRSIGSHEVFELIAGKRGKRLQWCDEHGARIFSQHIAHSDGRIFWRVADPDEIETAEEGKPAAVTLADVIDEGSRDWLRWDAFEEDLHSRLTAGKQKIHSLVMEGRKTGRITEDRRARDKMRPEVWLRVEDA